MRCVKCRQEFDRSRTESCPNCGTNQTKFMFKPIDLDPELIDLENADGILRAFSRIFLTLSIVSAIFCFFLMAHHGGRQLAIALLSSFGIIAVGILVWGICNVLVNISCNLRKIANK